MATPNYGFEKRQKELAKQRKKEEKARAKADRKAGIVHDQPGDADAPEAGEGAPAEGAAADARQGGG